jgi:RNA recognition motif-containing protein
MGNRIFVGNLNYSVTTEDLRNCFESCGKVTDAKVLTDRETGNSRGFGFVTFSTDAEAQEAIGQWDGQEFAGRTLKVNEAHERTDNRSGGGGGFRGGGGGGGPRNGGGGGGGRGGDRRRGGGRDRGGDHYGDG